MQAKEKEVGCIWSAGCTLDIPAVASPDVCMVTSFSSSSPSLSLSLCLSPSFS